MSEQAILRPVQGRLVPVPYQGRTLATDGERVTLSKYWRRRLADGDVERVPAPKAAPPKPAPKPAKAED